MRNLVSLAIRSRVRSDCNQKQDRGEKEAISVYKTGCTDGTGIAVPPGENIVSQLSG